MSKILILLLFLHILHSRALRCFRCDSRRPNESKCDIFEYVDQPSRYETECSLDVWGREMKISNLAPYRNVSPMCEKSTRNLVGAGYWVEVRRSCTYKPKLNKPCVVLKPSAEERNLVKCQCGTDLCNKSGRTSGFVSFHLFLCIVCALLK